MPLRPKVETTIIKTMGKFETRSTKPNLKPQEENLKERNAGRLIRLPDALSLICSMRDVFSAAARLSSGRLRYPNGESRGFSVHCSELLKIHGFRWNS